ncbi:MAG TPA: UDP-N-acetylglucosamine 1-carboxyvinyltransferase [Anaerolineae bacterium]|nr:UDP-N-acetylglucosamine 1-carboxyvinyltransferase [Anaerolineae bacterium]
MEQFVIEGGNPVSGVITPSGNKNAALPLIAASLLTDQPVTLHNIPRIRDVGTMLKLVGDLGAEVSEQDSGHTIRIRAANLHKTDLDADLCRDIRASILLAGPMLARLHQVELPPPGGDIIGRRRLDTHFLAFDALGAHVEVNSRFRLSAQRLVGTEILLDEASVTGTENAIMAAALAEGVTILRNAASEPHVQELCQLLQRMGACIEGIGSNALTIHGVKALGGAEFTIGPDYHEVGSYIGLAAITDGEILIKDAAPEHLGMIRLVFKRLGVRFERQGQDVFMPRGQSLTIVPDLGDAIPKIDDGPWPAFPADIMSTAIIIATQAAGTVLFHEKMFESRLFFIDRLIGMGARIILCDPHRCLVQGPNWLHPEAGGVASPDIRAGMALMLAALCAKGTSIIRNIGQIDRGYEHIEEKLQALGAKIERVKTG